jgi:RNA polymerase sigma factor (sigma-70 family)
MQARSIDPADEQVRAACAAGDVDRATTEALRRYGPELFGFLVGMHHDYDAASEAFAMFSEKLWQSLRGFQWECSLRAWCYRLARNAAIDVFRGARRRREIGLSSAPDVLQMAAQVRTSTMSALRTTNRTALEALRDELPEEDRAVLVLRIDRQLEWREVALVLASSSDDDARRVQDEAALKREVARLRKRLQLATERLRTLARERNLLGA